MTLGDPFLDEAARAKAREMVAPGWQRIGASAASVVVLLVLATLLHLLAEVVRCAGVSP